MSAHLPLRFARAILRCYPPAWRRRYADEVRSLLDETHPSWRSAADLTRGALREWVAPVHSGWPTRQALTRAQFTLFLAFYVGPIVITWLSLTVGDFVRARFGALPYAAGFVSAVMGLAVSTWLSTGVLRNAAAMLRRSPRLPVMLEGRVLLGLALLALIAGILASASRETTSESRLLALTPYLSAFTLGGLACMQSARAVRLARLNQAVVRRLQRRRLLEHIGPMLNLGDGAPQR